MNNKYIVIQSFPEGMVAVIRHTIHGLLLAELTGRKPVILWNSRFLYHNDRKKISQNGFKYYFEENNLCDIEPLKISGLTFSPSCWNCENIESDYMVEYRSLEERFDCTPLTPKQILQANEDVVVYTHYQHLVDLIPIVPSDSEYFGLDANTVANRVYKKYFMLNNEVKNSLDQKLSEISSQEQLLGIHCRGSDKIFEYAIATPTAYKAAIKNRFQNTKQIFLATDSQPYLHIFQEWYPRLHFIRCDRSTNNKGIHFSSGDVKKAGFDFLLDAYLLSHCDFHYGNIRSHVSYYVQAVLRNEKDAYNNFTNVLPAFDSKIYRLTTIVIPAKIKTIVKSTIKAK
jgi:protein O-GlcNAc transferase